MTITEIQDIVAKITYKDFTFMVKPHDNDLCIVYMDTKGKDVINGEEVSLNRFRVFVYPITDETTLVHGIYVMCQQYEMHECAEFFGYRGKAIYNPHIHIDDILTHLVGTR